MYSVFGGQFGQSPGLILDCRKGGENSVGTFSISFSVEKVQFRFLFENKVIHGLIFTKSHFYQYDQYHPRGVQKSQKFKKSTTDKIFNENIYKNY